MEEIIYDEGGEEPLHIFQRGSRCPIAGNIQGQVGRGSEQSDLVEDNPVITWSIGLDLSMSSPTQTLL